LEKKFLTTLGSLGWYEDRGLTLTAIRPHDVATYVEELQAAVRASSVKQQRRLGARAGDFRA
jgi:hypothetical protein